RGLRLRGGRPGGEGRRVERSDRTHVPNVPNVPNVPGEATRAGRVRRAPAHGTGHSPVTPHGFGPRFARAPSVLNAARVEATGGPVPTTARSARSRRPAATPPARA